MRVVALLALLLATAALAQLRTIPEDAKPARARHVEEGVIELNGQRTQLAPGAQIRDESNRIILPVALPPDSLVKVRFNEIGFVQQMWILTREEAEAR